MTFPNRRSRVSSRQFDDDALICTLVDFLDQKAMLSPSSGFAVRAASRHRAVPSDCYHLALPAHDTVEMLMSKASFQEFALREKVSVPRTIQLRGGADAERVATALAPPLAVASQGPRRSRGQPGAGSSCERRRAGTRAAR